MIVSIGLFSLYLDVFEFYVFCFDLQRVGTGIDLRAGRRREHLEFIRRRGEGYLLVDE